MSAKVIFCGLSGTHCDPPIEAGRQPLVQRRSATRGIPKRTVSNPFIREAALARH